MSDLKAERDRMRRLVRRDGYSSLMSDTKWRKVLDALTAEPHDFDMLTVKLLDIDQPRTLSMRAIGLHPPNPYIDTFELGAIDLVSIEWLELPDDAFARLVDIGELMIKRGDGAVRIIGHRK